MGGGNHTQPGRSYVGAGQRLRLTAPLLIVTVEDEVTGTGALVHRLIFGVTEKDWRVEIFRDWELLQVLNTLVACVIEINRVL
jgi:hypothetical protein